MAAGLQAGLGRRSMALSRSLNGLETPWVSKAAAAERIMDSRMTKSTEWQAWLGGVCSLDCFYQNDDPCKSTVSCAEWLHSACRTECGVLSISLIILTDFELTELN